MKITAAQYARALFELTDQKPQGEIGGVVADFLKVLKKDRKFGLANKIIENFSEIYNCKKKIVEAEITTSEALSNMLRNKVSSYVSSKYKADKVVLMEKIDKNIQGGIIIQVGDEILDGSIVRQLAILKKYLIS